MPVWKSERFKKMEELKDKSIGRNHRTCINCEEISECQFKNQSSCSNLIHKKKSSLEAWM